MKKLLTLITFKAFLFTGFAQSTHWQQQVDYILDVHLNDSSNTLNGFAKIRYINHSPDTLRFIWFHIWPNAYKNDRTAYSEQMLRNRNTRFYYSGDEQRGYINQLDFRINEKRVDVTDHPQHQDILQLILPQALAPNDSILITTPFHVKIPYNFSGEGYKGQNYQLVEWYPKPAVYDQYGWHVMPYSARGDNYSETGSYQVSISLPENYVVAASGELMNEEEKEWLKGRISFQWQPIKKRVRIKKGTYKTITQLYPASAARTKTLRFTQPHAHDFVWAADKRWGISYDSIILSNNKTIAICSYGNANQLSAHSLKMAAIKNALLFYDSALYPYPYHTIQLLPANRDYAAGNILLLNEAARFIPGSFNQAIASTWTTGYHSINTRQHPWLAIGIGSFYSSQLKDQTAKQKKAITPPGLQQTLLEAVAVVRKDQPVDIAADAYTALNYWLSANLKAKEWLKILQDSVGKNELQQAVQRWYQAAQQQHIYTTDLQEQLRPADNEMLKRWFGQLHTTGALTPATNRKIKLVWPGRLISDSGRRFIGAGPAIGYNYYDGFMLGGIIHNYSLPFSPFRFVAVPLYATGSKQLNGIGRASYTWYPQNYFYKIEAGMSVARFTADDFKDPENNHTVRMNFFKLAPYLRFNFKSKLQSSFNSYLQFKYYAIHEQGLQFRWDSIAMKNVYNLTNEQRGLLQVKWAAQNSRILYPYSWDVNIETGKDFSRLALTGNYFFNYGVHSGLDIRAFAGKFFYLGDKSALKRANTYRYRINMTAPKGDEDYTYSNYFAGRNEFEGFFSQQVMMRDGGFKVRADLLSNKIGRTDDWLAAINLTSSFHPKVPVKLFADIGTYSDAWKNESNETRILFDAGLQVSLIKNILNVYVPLLYSKVYRDYFRSTPGNNFLQRISFSIDIQHVRFKNIHPAIPF